jgi:hypothetical protein
MGIGGVHEKGEKPEFSVYRSLKIGTFFVYRGGVPLVMGGSFWTLRAFLGGFRGYLEKGSFLMILGFLAFLRTLITSSMFTILFGSRGYVSFSF